ncbi:MAG: tyrosine-type recombinase/integrase [Candidatus Sulfotelmatobacter sp.]
MVWLQWNLHGKQFRQPTHSSKWEVASKMARNIEADYEASATRTPKPAEPITIESAVSKFLADRQAQQLRPATVSKLRTIFENQFLMWCAAHRVRYLRDVTLPVLQDWRSSWTDGPLASKKKQERVRGFFHFCLRNRWIDEHPALGLSRIKAEHRPAEYFPHDEFAQIVQVTNIYGRNEVERTRIRTLVMLLRWSGLAIRDAVTLERSRLGDDNRLMVRRAKTGVPVMLPLNPTVADSLRNIPAGPRPNPRYFFWSGNGDPKSAVADWQRALRRLFDLAEIKHPDGTPKRCHPHMFRHTFSIELLIDGVPLEDVAQLLGHSSVKTTEKYYASWVKARADRLERVMEKQWNA